VSLSRACAPLILIGAALVYAWPIVASLRSAVPGGPTDLDVATMVWNVGYVYRALTTGGDLLATREVLVPFGADLRLHTYGLLQGLAAAPLVPLVGVIAAFNLMLIATLALNGVASYALIRHVGAAAPAALVAATCFMLASPLLDQIRVGRPTFASLWLVAIALLISGSLAQAPRVWKGLLLGLSLLAALLTDFQIALFSAVWLVVFGITRFRTRHLAALAVAALVSGVPFGLLFAPALVGASAAGYPQPDARDMLEYSFRIWDYLDPAVLPHAYGVELGLGAIAALILSCRGVLRAIATLILSRGSGLRAIAAPMLARRGASRSRAKSPVEPRWNAASSVWLIGAAVCLVLALGPYLQPTEIPLPFGILSTWPPLAQFRTPYRMAMPAALGLAVVLGLVLSQLSVRWSGLVPAQSSDRLVAAPTQHSVRPFAGLAVLLVVARLAFAIVHDPLTMQVYPTYALYARLAAEPGDLTLVEVPFGVRSGLDRVGNGGEVLSIYQHVHRKPLLNGMIARLPSSVFDAYRAHPSLLFLSGDRPVADVGADSLADADADLDGVLRWSNAGYVVVHRNLLDARQADAILALLDRQPSLVRDSVEADLVAYRVRR